MKHYTFLILSLFLSIGAFSKEIKIVDIFKDKVKTGLLGIDIDGRGGINYIYTFEEGIKTVHKISDLGKGLPVVQRVFVPIVSIHSNDFNRETGGKLLVKFMTKVTGLMNLTYDSESFELARTDGGWKVYNSDEVAIKNFLIEVRHEKGKETGIASIKSN